MSRIGLMLRASRDDEVAARASAVNIVRVRLAAFIVSAEIVGMGGALWGHFLGVLAADTFYPTLSFVTLAVLVVGGLDSLSGAVAGVIVVTLVVQALRTLERGVTVGSGSVTLPPGSQEIGLGLVLARASAMTPPAREVGNAWSRAGVRGGSGGLTHPATA